MKRTFFAIGTPSAGKYCSLHAENHQCCSKLTMLICLSESGVLIGLYVSFLLGSNLKIAKFCTLF